MTDTSSRLALPLIKPSQAQKHVTHNEALLILDGLVQTALEQTDALMPPLDPVDGTVFALGATPSEAWEGEGGHLALRAGGGWVFLIPRDGWRAWDKADAALKVYSDGNWARLEPDFNNLEGVGINTTADTTNKLSVASDASLFSHDGNGHQIKVNKSEDTDTASLLFQSAWTGHAEMGLAGDTDFSIKVSPDGSVWQNALMVSAASGHVSFPQNVTINGGSISGITDLAISDGGTGASSASAARSNLGLGSIATQGADSVSITGGVLDGVAIGASSPATGSFTTITGNGDLVVDADKFFFDASAVRLGLGTDTPTEELDIVSSSTQAAIRVGGGNSAELKLAVTSRPEYDIKIRTSWSDESFAISNGNGMTLATVTGFSSPDEWNFYNSDLIAVTIGGGNLLVGGTSRPANADAALVIFNGTAPTGSVTDGVALYSEDVAGSAELKVRDEAGNVTTLSPHNFSAIPGGSSEPGAWAHYSEFESPDGRKAINVDMLKLARLLEDMTGETLVHISSV